MLLVFSQLYVKLDLNLKVFLHKLVQNYMQTLYVLDENRQNLNVKRLEMDLVDHSALFDEDGVD
jgi:hypothetical protein